ncbi:MAG: hypothetical protein OXI16_15015 [Chloroflexota bacterium]|nr:hypothetical protein [Chloroflexota bacterium]
MTNNEARVEALLNSLVGCEFLVTLVESGLSPEDLADPKISLSLAGLSADSVEIWRADHDLIAADLPARAKCSYGRAWTGFRATVDVDIPGVIDPPDRYSVNVNVKCRVSSSGRRYE